MVPSKYLLNLASYHSPPLTLFPPSPYRTSSGCSRIIHASRPLCMWYPCLEHLYCLLPQTPTCPVKLSSIVSSSALLGHRTWLACDRCLFSKDLAPASGTMANSPVCHIISRYIKISIQAITPYGFRSHSTFKLSWNISCCLLELTLEFNSHRKSCFHSSQPST